MSEANKLPTPVNPVDEREIEVKVSKTIQLTCPVCQKQNFEQILLRGGKNIMFWRKYTPTWLDKQLSRFVGERPRLVTSYRCRNCDYIMSFARTE